MTYDYAILGAGVSGMTTAVILAKHGFSSVVIEKSSRTAPVIRGFRRGGFFFDTGFHYAGGLGDGEILDIFFRYLGFDGRIRKRKYDEDGFDIFHSLKPTIEWSFPCGYDRILEKLSGLFPHDRPAIRAYLRETRTVCEAQPYLNLKADLAAVPLLGSDAVTLKEFLDRLTDNEDLKSVLSMHTLLHGSHPSDVPFTIHACVAGLYYQSVHGVEGGGLSIANAYDRRLEELGVEVKTGQGAVQLSLSPAGNLEGIVLENGEVVPCRNCVSTVHPKVLLEMVPESVFRPIYRKRLAALEESASAHILYLSFDGPEPCLDGRNLFLFSTPVFPRFDAPLEDRPLYVATAACPESSEKSGCVVICMGESSETEPWASSCRGNRPSGYGAYKQEIRERLLHRLNDFFPGFSSRADVIDQATPLTMRDYANAPEGSVYGAKHKVGQLNPLSQTRLKQLLLAGQSVVAPGLLGAVISAFLACGFILGHNSLREELRQCR